MLDALGGLGSHDFDVVDLRLLVREQGLQPLLVDLLVDGFLLEDLVDGDDEGDTDESEADES